MSRRLWTSETGNLGDHKSVGAVSGKLVLLLFGGDKSTQTADVARAQESWKAYQEGKRRGESSARHAAPDFMLGAVSGAADVVRVANT